MQNSLCLRLIWRGSGPFIERRVAPPSQVRYDSCDDLPQGSQATARAKGWDRRTTVMWPDTADPIGPASRK
jgi:hypothetical protein